jgi:hypothetical protein
VVLKFVDRDNLDEVESLGGGGFALCHDESLARKEGFR